MSYPSQFTFNKEVIQNINFYKPIFSPITRLNTKFFILINYNLNQNIEKFPQFRGRVVMLKRDIGRAYALLGYNTFSFPKSYHPQVFHFYFNK